MLNNHASKSPNTSPILSPTLGPDPSSLNRNKNMYRLNPLDSTAGVDDLLDFTEFELNPSETKNRQ
jgi:hypothetical protein